MYLSNKNKFKIYYLFYRDKSSNKIKKVTTKTKLKKKALEFVNKFKPDDFGKAKDIHIFNFNELKDEVLKYTAQNYTASTNQIYRNTINNFIKIIGNKTLASITINDIEFYKSERLKSINKVTLNIDIRTLKTIFNFALKWNMVKENPCKFVNKYIISEKEKLSFEDTDITKILSLFDNDTIKNIVLFALYTGCRINEILNVQWNDVDFVQKILTIRNKPNFQTKTGKIRQIPISDKLFEILNIIFIGNNDENNKIYNFHSKDEYVFTNKKGIKFNRNYITGWFKRHLRFAGISEKYHFHCLRHTFITSLIKRGVNINYVKEIVGHSDIGTTMNYIHIVTEDLRSAVNQI